MKKLFLCVGAAKTGTTWLHGALRGNPDLWFPPEKELHYHFSVHGRFDRLTREIRDGVLARALEREESRDDPGREARLDWYRRFAAGPVSDVWYRDLFRDAPNDAWPCDFSPSTSLIPDPGWRAVNRAAQEIRVVYILREPAERLWSHAKFHAAHMDRFKEFERMSLREIERLINRFRLWEDGDYGSHLKRMRAHLPREAVLLLPYRMIADDPQGARAAVEAHLGVRPTPTGAEAIASRVNASEAMNPPEGFGAAWRGRFAREMNALADQGVAFARPWAERYPLKPLDRLGGLARAFAR